MEKIILLQQLYIPHADVANISLESVSYLGFLHSARALLTIQLVYSSLIGCEVVAGLSPTTLVAVTDTV